MTLQRKVYFFWHYWLKHAVWWLLWWWFVLLRRWMFWKYAEAHVATLAIVDFNLNARDDARFVSATKEALALIQESDPRTFRMVVREVRLVVNRELTSGANYDRALRACNIDFGRYAPLQGEDVRLAAYCLAIVHEAAHGRIYSLGFPYTPRTRVRIERICRAHECRFARKMPRDRFPFAEQLVRPFDEREWQFWWETSGLRQRKELLSRIKESLHVSNED